MIESIIFADYLLIVAFDCHISSDIYRGQLMSNPNMMFFLERTDVPLFDLDVTAWLLLAHITGDMHPPLEKNMRQFNLETLLDVMKDPIARGYYCENYRKRWCKVSDSHWSCETSDKRVKQMDKSHLDLQFRILARDIVDVKYPLQIGSYEKLNEKGKALVEFNHICGHARYDLDEGSSDADWKTFRDCNPSKCYSIMTGTKAVPLKCHWLDLDGDGVDDIVDDDTSRRKQKGLRGVTAVIRDKLRMIARS